MTESSGERRGLKKAAVKAARLDFQTHLAQLEAQGC